MPRDRRPAGTDQVTGKAATSAVNDLAPTVVPACPRKGCYRANGHHGGLHGYRTPGSGDGGGLMDRAARRRLR